MGRRRTSMIHVWRKCLAKEPFGKASKPLSFVFPHHILHARHELEDLTCFLHSVARHSLWIPSTDIGYDTTFRTRKTGKIVEKFQL